MNDKNFLEAIDDETLAKLIDTTLRFEKNKKSEKPGFGILKIVSAAAAIVLVIGLVNMLPRFITADNPGPGAHHAGSNAENTQTTTAEIQNPVEPVALFVPPIIEKTFFEEKILAGITNQRDRDKMLAYYTLIDLTGFDSHDWGDKINEAFAEAIATYPICESVPIYICDPHASGRELFFLLSILEIYTELTGDELIYMYETNGIPYEELPMFTGENFAEDEENVQSTVETQKEPEPDYGVNTAEDGTKYIEFKNKSLYAALLEYFDLDRWFDRITPDMLWQIDSIEVKVKPEYSYIYDNKGLREEFGLDCKYIEYTINGKTLGILPEKFMEGGALEGHMEQAALDIYEYFNYENG
ncbi:MAG: hypothetical protein FWD23_14755, partial [Oscillospiraceae bacterium]|nr:hypothetical protein [Oscillospiraceae bacterium]